jgi:hypothetical protein
MASKSTNSTIYTVAIVAMAGYVVWKMFGKGTKKASAATMTQAGVGSGYGSDYYAPDQAATDSSSSLSNLISQLANMVTGKGGGGSGSSKQGYAQNATSAAAANPAMSQAAGNYLQGSENLDNALSTGEQNAGEAYVSPTLDSSALSESLMALPTFDVPDDTAGAFITSANNGSSDAMSGINPGGDSFGSEDYSSGSGGDYGSGLDFSGLDESLVDLPEQDLPDDSGSDDSGE